MTFHKGNRLSPEIKAKIKAAVTRHKATAQARSDKIIAASKAAKTNPKRHENK